MNLLLGKRFLVSILNAVVNMFTSALTHSPTVTSTTGFSLIVNTPPFLENQ